MLGYCGFLGKEAEFMTYVYIYKIVFSNIPTFNYFKNCVVELIFSK